MTTEELRAAMDAATEAAHHEGQAPLRLARAMLDAAGITEKTYRPPWQNMLALVAALQEIAV